MDAKNAKKATIAWSSATVTIYDGIKPALTSIQSKEAVPSLKLDVQAYPNPTTSSFTIKVLSNNRKDVISMTVTDVNGRVMEKRNNIIAGQTVQLGSAYRTGIYFVEVLQGENRKQVKLLKTVW